MKIPKKYLHKSGNLNSKALQVEGSFTKGEPHPDYPLIVFKQYTKLNGVRIQRWETLEASMSSLSKRRVCNMTEEKREHLRNYDKEWRKNNRDRVKEWKRLDHIKHREKNIERAVRWAKNNPQKRRDTRKRFRCRKQDDIHYKVTNNLRDHMRRIRPGYKSDSTSKLLGCSIDRACEHIGIQFTEGMSWDNYGEWHIDHIIPCAFFDLTKPSHQKVCFNYQNLQPMWASENCSKQDKIHWSIVLTLMINNYKTIGLN